MMGVERDGYWKRPLLCRLGIHRHYRTFVRDVLGRPPQWTSECSRCRYVWTPKDRGPSVAIASGLAFVLFLVVQAVRGGDSTLMYAVGMLAVGYIAGVFIGLSIRR